MDKRWICLIVAGVLGLAALDARAVVLSLSDGTSTFTIFDQTPQDDNPVQGVVAFLGAVGTWGVNVTAGISKPVLGSAATPKLDLVSVDVSSGTGLLTIKFSDDDFGPLPAGLGFRTNVGGTTDGEVAFTTSFDEDNELFGGGPLLASLGPYGPGAFSGTQFTPAAPGHPFSLTLAALIDHETDGVSSFDLELETEPVPEPGTLLLVGPGLAGLLALVRRRPGRTRSSA